MSDCYHDAMRRSLVGAGWLFPEQAKWIIRGRPSPRCTQSPCVHWPLFTVIDGSPYLPFFGEAEIYKGFRSEPQPLMGILKLHTEQEIDAIKSNQEYLRGRLVRCGRDEDA